MTYCLSDRGWSDLYRMIERGEQYNKNYNILVKKFKDQKKEIIKIKKEIIVY